jgi:hypothetical protein
MEHTAASPATGGIRLLVRGDRDKMSDTGRTFLSRVARRLEIVLLPPHTRYI